MLGTALPHLRISLTTSSESMSSAYRGRPAPRRRTGEPAGARAAGEWPAAYVPNKGPSHIPAGIAPGGPPPSLAGCDPGAAFALLAGAARARPGAAGSEAGQGDRGLEGRAPLRRGQLQRAAGHGHPVADRPQTDSALFGGVIRIIRVAVAIVPHRQLDPGPGAVPRALQSDPDLVGFGVLDDLVERLLGDAVQDRLDRSWEPGGPAAVVEVALDGGGFAHLAQHRLERRGEAELADRRGADPQDHLAQLIGGVLDRLLDRRQGGDCLRSRRLAQADPRDLGLEEQPGQGLEEAVAHLPGDAPPLDLLGVDRLAQEPGQALLTVAQGGVQVGLLDRQRGQVGDRRSEPQVLRGVAGARPPGQVEDSEHPPVHGERQAEAGVDRRVDALEAGVADLPVQDERLVVLGHPAGDALAQGDARRDRLGRQALAAPYLQALGGFVQQHDRAAVGAERLAGDLQGQAELVVEVDRAEQLAADPGEHLEITLGAPRLLVGGPRRVAGWIGGSTFPHDYSVVICAAALEPAASWRRGFRRPGRVVPPAGPYTRSSRWRPLGWTSGGPRCLPRSSTRAAASCSGPPRPPTRRPAPPRSSR